MGLQIQRQIGALVIKLPIAQFPPAKDYGCLVRIDPNLLDKQLMNTFIAWVVRPGVVEPDQQLLLLCFAQKLQLTNSGCGRGRDRPA